MRRSTIKLFESWHQGEPREVIRLGASWARTYKLIGIAEEIVYYSEKWVQVGDEPSEYVHKFEGAPCYVWAPGDDGYTTQALRPAPGDVAKLGDALELRLDDGEEFVWSRGRAHLVGIDRSRFAIVTSAKLVPLVFTNTKVTAAGIDDR